MSKWFENFKHFLKPFLMRLLFIAFLRRNLLSLFSWSKKYKKVDGYSEKFWICKQYFWTDNKTVYTSLYCYYLRNQDTYPVCRTLSTHNTQWQICYPRSSFSFFFFASHFWLIFHAFLYSWPIFEKFLPSVRRTPFK